MLYFLNLQQTHTKRACRATEIGVRECPALGLIVLGSHAHITARESPAGTVAVMVTQESPVEVTDAQGSQGSRGSPAAEKVLALDPLFSA